MPLTVRRIRIEKCLALGRVAVAAVTSRIMEMRSGPDSRGFMLAIFPPRGNHVRL